MNGVGAAAVVEGEVRKIALPGVASIFSAELHAIRLALKIVITQPYSKYLICSDSLSSIQALQNPSNRNPLVQRLQSEIRQLQSQGNSLIFFVDTRAQWYCRI